MPEMQIEIRNVYGLFKAYPLNDTAKAVALLAGTKTLTAEAISIATARLGLTVAVVAAPLGASLETCE